MILHTHTSVFGSPYRWNDDIGRWEYWNNIDAAWLPSVYHVGTSLRRPRRVHVIAYAKTWAEPIRERRRP